MKKKKILLFFLIAILGTSQIVPIYAAEKKDELNATVVFEKGTEAADTSYNFYCHRNFHWGLEIQNVGVVIEDYYISHVATCSPSGNVTLAKSGF